MAWYIAAFATLRDRPQSAITTKLWYLDPKNRIGKSLSQSQCAKVSYHRRIQDFKNSRIQEFRMIYISKNKIFQCQIFNWPYLSISVLTDTKQNLCEFIVIYKVGAIHFQSPVLKLSYIKMVNHWTRLQGDVILWLICLIYDLGVCYILRLYPWFWLWILGDKPENVMSSVRLLWSTRNISQMNSFNGKFNIEPWRLALPMTLIMN